MALKDPKNPGKPGQYLRVFIFLLLGILILWLIGRGQDIDLILKEFRDANYFWIVLAFIAALLSHLIRAIRWNLLIDSLGFKTSATVTFNALMTGYLANMAVPRLGEITRCVVLNRQTKVPFNALIGTVVAERVFDMFTLIVIIFMTVAFQFEFLKEFMNNFFLTPLVSGGAHNIMTLVLILFGVLIIAVILFFFLRKKLTSPLPESFYFKLKHQLSGLKNGILTIWTIRKKMLFVVYSMLIWGMYFMTVYLCFLAIQSTAHLPLSAGLTVLVMGSLGVVAPVPGGIGTYHFLAITTLTELYGIAAEPAISYAYIAHATQTLVIILTGTWAWISISLKNQRNPIKGMR